MNRDNFYRVKNAIREILDSFGVDLKDPNVIDTPQRVAEMFSELFSSVKASEPDITIFPNDKQYETMVIVEDIPFYSLCAHHLVPFYGKAHVAYIPKGKIIGLSKIARIVDFYSKKPQVQENLTEEIVRFIWRKLEPLGVMTVIEARHLCMEMRGVKKPGAVTVTSAIRGVFFKKEVREEFLSLIRFKK